MDPVHRKGSRWMGTPSFGEVIGTSQLLVLRLTRLVHTRPGAMERIHVGPLWNGMFGLWRSGCAGKEKACHVQSNGNARKT
eukprot:scaffold545_cov372-Pavlova_lutheri.AAC.10